MSKWLAALLFSCSVMLFGCSDSQDGGELPQGKTDAELKKDEKNYEAKMKEAMQGGPQKSDAGN